MEGSSTQAWTEPGIFRNEKMIKGREEGKAKTRLLSE